MQQAKCTNCGAEIEVDEKLEAAICKECKKPVIVTSAIENYKDSLEPNKPIIRNQEDLDKTNFRLKFNLVVSIIMLTFFSLVFLNNLIHEIFYAVKELNEYRVSDEWVFPIFKIIFSFMIVVITSLYIYNILSLKNKIKYNKKKEINIPSSQTLIWSVMSFVLIICYFVISVLNLSLCFPVEFEYYHFNADLISLIIQATYLIVIPTLFAILSCFVLIFNINTYKIIKKHN